MLSPSRSSLLLSSAPKFLPPTSSSTSCSPTRRPLHEQSASEINQRTGPTIRIVEESDDDVYLKFPTPSEPSQILPPPRHAPGYGFERPEPRVSSGSRVAHTVATIEAGRDQVAQPSQLASLQREKKFRQSTSTRGSDADTLAASTLSPSTVRLSQGSVSTVPTSPSLGPTEIGKTLELPQITSSLSSNRPTIRAVPPSSSGGESMESYTLALTPKASNVSLSSSVSDSLPVTSSSPGDLSSIGVSQTVPSNHHYTSSTESGSSHALAHNTGHQQLRLTPSIDSLTCSDLSSTSIEPSLPSSPPTLHEARTTALASDLAVHYPIVRVPSSNSLRAQVQRAPSYTSITSRMQEYPLAHHWSSQLSTIASVSERDSRSLARSPRSFSPRSTSVDSYGSSLQQHTTRRRGQTVGSIQSSSDAYSSEGHTEFSAVPRPLFSPISRSTTENHDHDRDHYSEHLDTVSPLPSTVPLRMKSSGYLKRQHSDAGSTDSRPGSAHSDISTYIHNAIPAWARVYYRRGERVSIAASDTDSSRSLGFGRSYSGRTNTPSESGYAQGIYRPRNRPSHYYTRSDSLMSMSDEARPMDRGPYIVGSDSRPASGWSTPHLRRDRRNNMRYSAWTAPSFDSDLNSSIFGLQNRQILLFCLGFIFPIAWIIASFLPLPPDTLLGNLDPSQLDIEQHFDQRFGSYDNKAYQKATWWRNLNRIMSGIGTLLIGVIVALAILVSRMATEHRSI